MACEHIPQLDAGDCKDFVGDHYLFMVNAIQSNTLHVDEDFDLSGICSLPDETLMSLAIILGHGFPDTDVQKIIPGEVCVFASHSSRVDIDAETCQELVGQNLGALKQAIKYVL